MKLLLCVLTIPILVVVTPLQALQATDAESFFGIGYASQPEEGVLFAGQPSQEQLRALAEAGYKVVIDLRTEAEDRGFDEPGLARQLGLTYVHLPVSAESLQDPQILGQFASSLDEAERPVLVHCGSSNRVGALYYSYLVLKKGVERPAALETAKKYGLRSAQLVELVDALLEKSGQ